MSHDHGKHEAGGNGQPYSPADVELAEEFGAAS